MSADGEKKNGALPPSGMTRLSQRDIGKVARLFRDSGFRYRVFDAETGEHQIVDPVRPLPPLDHVPPVWPPPLEDDPEQARRRSERPPPPPRPRAAAQPQPSRAAVAEPEQNAAALRADARAAEIFRAVETGAGQPVPRSTPAKEVTMRSNPPTPTAPKIAAGTPVRSAGRVVAFPGSTLPERRDDASGQERSYRGGPSVASVVGKLMQPPPPPPRRAPVSTAAVLRSILGKRPED